MALKAKGYDPVESDQSCTLTEQPKESEAFQAIEHTPSDLFF